MRLPVANAGTTEAITGARAAAAWRERPEAAEASPGARLRRSRSLRRGSRHRPRFLVLAGISVRSGDSA